MMLACSLLSYIDRQTLAQLSPMILGDLKLSAQRYGEIISAFSWAYALANPLWGSILDRIGLRRGMILAVTIWSLACGAHAVLAGFLGFAIARGVLGFGEGATFPGGLRAATDSLPPKKQSRGLAVAYGGGPVGAIVTPLIVTPVALRYGWRAAFIVTGAAGFLWVLAWSTSVEFSAAASRQTQRIEIPNLLERRFWSLVSAYALGALPLALILYLAQIYLARALGLTQRELGLTLWIPPMGWAVGYFLWGWFNDRFTAGHRRPAWLIGILAAMSLPLASITLFRSSAAVLGLMFFAMFVASGFVVVALRTSALAYPSEQTGLVAGIGAGSWSAVVGVVMPLFGRMFDAGHYAGAFALASVVPLVGAGLWLLLTLPERDLLEVDVTK
jgi:MFS transporter, ACS family, aldohexuronate transporter